MRGQPELVSAARIGRLFRIDPVAVLAETDQVAYAARIAAFQVVADDMKAAAEQARAGRR